MTRTHTTAACTLLLAATLTTAAAGQLPPIAEQIAGAVLPLPPNQRDGATVLGYRTAGKLTVLREGSGEMVCLADEPGNDAYHVACYHESLEPLMTMGRELTARGVVDPQRDSTRAAAAETGRLKMPEAPAAFHSLTAPVSAWDAATRTLRDAAPLHTVYVPWATGETTGLSTVPASGGEPWLMFPGSYKAHIMIQPPRTGGP